MKILWREQRGPLAPLHRTAGCLIAEGAVEIDEGLQAEIWGPTIVTEVAIISEGLVKDSINGQIDLFDLFAADELREASEAVQRRVVRASQHPDGGREDREYWQRQFDEASHA